MIEDLIVSRRSFIQSVALGAANLSGGKLLQAGAGKGEEYRAPTAAEALLRLKEGNERFVSGHMRNENTSREWRSGLVSGQNPFAIILGCSDSRVPTELVFDQGFGDLFVIRNAGNIIATDVLGSIEYAMHHLGCRLVLMMGHEQCGAVTAALMSQEEVEQEAIEVQEIIRDIKRGLAQVELPTDTTRRISAAVEADVRWSVKQARDLLAERRPASLERAKAVGAVYALDTGRVRFLEGP